MSKTHDQLVLEQYCKAAYNSDHAAALLKVLKKPVLAITDINAVNRASRERAAYGDEFPAASTALHIACHDGHEELTNELIKRGANLNAQDANGHTPLHVVINAIIQETGQFHYLEEPSSEERYAHKQQIATKLTETLPRIAAQLIDNTIDPEAKATAGRMIEDYLHPKPAQRHFNDLSGDHEIAYHQPLVTDFDGEKKAALMAITTNLAHGGQIEGKQQGEPDHSPLEHQPGLGRMRSNSWSHDVRQSQHKAKSQTPEPGSMR